MPPLESERRLHLQQKYNHNAAMSDLPLPQWPLLNICIHIDKDLNRNIYIHIYPQIQRESDSVSESTPTSSQTVKPRFDPKEGPLVDQGNTWGLRETVRRRVQFGPSRRTREGQDAAAGLHVAIISSMLLAWCESLTSSGLSANQRNVRSYRSLVTLPDAMPPPLDI